MEPTFNLHERGRARYNMVLGKARRRIVPGGGGEIRTHEPLRIVGLVNRWNQPLSDASLP